MGDGADRTPETRGESDESLLPVSIMAQIFATIFNQDMGSAQLVPHEAFIKFFHMACQSSRSPNTAISKIVCFGLGSIWKIKREEKQAHGLVANEVEAVRRTLLRHAVAIQLGAVANSFRIGETLENRKLQPVRVYLCDPEYTDMDKEWLEPLGALEAFGKGCAVKVLNSVDSGIQEVDKDTFIFCVDSNPALRQRVLNCGFDLRGMLWPDHVYHDLTEDK